MLVTVGTWRTLYNTYELLLRFCQSLEKKRITGYFGVKKKKKKPKEDLKQIGIKCRHRGTGFSAFTMSLYGLRNQNVFLFNNCVAL